MWDLEEQQLLDAASAGDLAGVKAALAAGADVHAVPSDETDSLPFEELCALRVAAINGHTAVVACLLDAGADAAAAGLLEQALQGHADICYLLRRHGALLFDLRSRLAELNPAVQVALLGAGDVSTLAAPELAHEGIWPAALVILLERQGHAELAAMLTATQMLEPMAPDERGAVLAELMAQPPMAVVHVGL